MVSQKRGLRLHPAGRRREPFRVSPGTAPVGCGQRTTPKVEELIESRDFSSVFLPSPHGARRGSQLGSPHGALLVSRRFELGGVFLRGSLAWQSRRKNPKLRITCDSPESRANQRVVAVSNGCAETKEGPLQDVVDIGLGFLAELQAVRHATLAATRSVANRLRAARQSSSSSIESSMPRPASRLAMPSPTAARSTKARSPYGVSSRATARARASQVCSSRTSRARRTLSSSSCGSAARRSSSACSASAS